MRWLLVLAVAFGCGGGQAAPRRSPAAAADRFARVERLIDLYDTARLAKDASARAGLGRELGVEVGSGPAATDRVIAALLVEVDRVLAADRLHAGAQAARTLLEFDRRPAAGRGEVLQRLAEVKAIARGDGPLSRNATLRLAAYCWRALDDAARAPWRQRPFVVSHCLYPLFDSDPDPYFARDADRRPPLPRWQDLLAGAEHLLFDQAKPLGGGASLVVPRASWGRLDTARQALGQRLLNLKATGGGELPVEPAPEVLVADAPLYDWTPVAAPQPDLDALRVAVQGDGRGKVALLVPAGGAGDIPELARAARAAGAGEVQLLVARRQRIQAPPGDYWHGKPAEVQRAAVIDVSLAPLGGTAASGARSPYAVDFASGLRLTLVIGAGRWRLVGEEGELASIASAGPPDPAEQLVEALARVRAAFPDQHTLALHAEPAAPNRDVLTAAAAAARRHGTPFFRLGMAVGPPRLRASSLARRVARRAGASVKVVPDTLAARGPALLACYQDAIERAPKLAGKVRLEIKGGAAAVVGAADRRLAGCASKVLGRAIVEAGAASAEVSFRLSGSR